MRHACMNQHSCRSGHVRSMNVKTCLSTEVTPIGNADVYWREATHAIGVSVVLIRANHQEIICFGGHDHLPAYFFRCSSNVTDTASGGGKHVITSGGGFGFSKSLLFLLLRASHFPAPFSSRCF
eukprot:2041051-Amphidinium_carterae.1